MERKGFDEPFKESDRLTNINVGCPGADRVVSDNRKRPTVTGDVANNIPKLADNLIMPDDTEDTCGGSVRQCLGMEVPGGFSGDWGWCKQQCVADPLCKYSSIYECKDDNDWCRRGESGTEWQCYLYKEADRDVIIDRNDSPRRDYHSCYENLSYVPPSPP